MLLITDWERWELLLFLWIQLDLRCTQLQFHIPRHCSASFYKPTFGADRRRQGDLGLNVTYSREGKKESSMWLWFHPLEMHASSSQSLGACIFIITLSKKLSSTMVKARGQQGYVYKHCFIIVIATVGQKKQQVSTVVVVVVCCQLISHFNREMLKKRSTIAIFQWTSMVKRR